MLFVLRACMQVLIVDACSRVIYNQKAGDTTAEAFHTGRTMDWFEDTQSDLWAFPAGMERDGGLGEGSIEWTSTYGSVAVSMYGLSTVDGMNEAGLGVNCLYLTEADHGNAWREEAGQEKLSIGAWAQYLLDNFATVADAVAWARPDEINIVAPPLPGGKPASAHVAITDETGDSAIFEYLGGYLVIHHGPQYTVMTNSPPFDQQLAITAYWESVKGFYFLPGTHRASDRFARLSWNLKSVPEVSDAKEALTITMSLIRHMSVPFGIQDPEKPNIASTTWRTICSHGSRVYYFEPVNSPSIFWVDVANLELSKPGAVVKKLTYTDKILSGEVSAFFEPSPPFEFIKPGDHDDNGGDTVTTAPPENDICGPLDGNLCKRVPGCFWMGSKCEAMTSASCYAIQDGKLCRKVQQDQTCVNGHRCQWDSVDDACNEALVC